MYQGMHNNETYRQNSNISRTKSHHFIISRLGLRLPSPSQVLSREWRCSWSSTDRHSNYIWVINNFIAYQGAAYIIVLTVMVVTSLFIHGWFNNCPFDQVDKAVAVATFPFLSVSSTIDCFTNLFTSFTLLTRGHVDPDGADALVVYHISTTTSEVGSHAIKCTIDLGTVTCTGLGSGNLEVWKYK